MSAPISEVVSVVITRDTASITREGFGTALIAAHHTYNLDRVRTYSELAELTADGFAVTHPAYLAAQSLLSQSPRVEKFKVGRRALPTTQKTNFIPTDITVGKVYTITFKRANGTTATATYTVAAADTVALIVAGLLAAIAALSPVLGATTTNLTTSFDVTATLGTLLDVSTESPLTVKNVTVDPGIATDLAAINLEDNDWYALILDSNSHAEVVAAAAWVQANDKTLGADTIDSATGTVVATDVMSAIQAATYDRTFVVRAANLLSYAGAAALGKELPTDPGTSALAYKTLAGVTVPRLNTTERTYIEAKKGSHISTIAGLNVLRYGTTGSGERYDIIRLIDALKARIQEDVFQMLVSNPKLPYTDLSVDAVKGTILAAIKNFQPSGIALDPAPTVTAPLVSAISSVDRGNRLLPDVKFTATLAGAIEKINISGRVSV